MQTKSCYILLIVFFVLMTKNNFAQQSVDSVQQIDTVNILSQKSNVYAVYVYKTPNII